MPKPDHRLSSGLLAAALLSCTTAAAQPFAHTYPREFADRQAMIDTLRERAGVALPWMTTDTGRALVEATETLPPRIRRWRWATQAYTDNTFTPEQFEDLPESQQQRLDFLGIPELVYYGGWTQDAPFVEFRAFDLAVSGTPLAEPEALAGTRILLLDAGVITHAWTLARLGAHVTIVTDSQRFRAVYNAPSDRGTVRGINGAPDGSVTIVDAQWPADESTDLGEPFDLIIALNTLNTGRVNPTAHHMRSGVPNLPTKPIGPSPEWAARRLADALAPGGRLLIYSWGLPPRPNASPAPGGDVRPGIEPEIAREAGLEPVALASDSSVFNRILGNRQGADDVRRPLDADGLTAPQISVMYALFQKP